MKPYFGAGSGDLRADRRYDMAMGLMEGGDYAAAADLLRDAQNLAPKWPPIHFYLGEVLRIQGHWPEAGAHFNDYLSLDSEDAMGAKVKLSLMGQHDINTAMTKTYVKSLFDQYAPRFETSLVQNLGYDIPSIMAEDIKGDFRHLLDLGCGTGLVGAAFSGRIQTMTGVDLSDGMISVCREKNLYNHLHAMDVRDFLNHTKTKFDLVTCADVLIYLSDLSTLFENIRNVMNESGIFTFSTQDHEGPDEWILGQDHRYAHSKPYIERLLKNCNLMLINQSPCDLRKDGHGIVKGRLYISQKV